jgi:signal transduction histidine kinase
MRLLAEAQLEANERLMMAEKNLKDALELEKKQKAELDKLVSQLKDTQTQLVHNEKMASLGQLTAGIAHEINNPINFVYNGIDTLKISLDDLMEIVNKYNELDQANVNKEEIIEEVKALKNDLDYEELIGDINHLVSDIKKGAVRTMEIVKGLRVFSRLDEEERKMASIKDCLESTLILLNNKIKNKITLKTFYDESMPEILCYPGQLNQVFMNIINNAIQAIPEEKKDGEIVIYTENLQENVVIRIKDNGVGMSEQVKRRIFEPFFTTKQVGVGTGLGLSITFGIIEKHGGNIFVNSEEGRGTEFVIQLPKVSH